MFGLLGCFAGVYVPGDVPAATANEDADVHRESPMTVEPECDSFIWTGSSKDIRDVLQGFAERGLCSLRVLYLA